MATLSIDPRLSRRTADFVSTDHRMLIDGRFAAAASGKTFPVYNPATGEVVTHVPEAEAEDVNRAVMAARRAFDEGPWPRMSPSERGRVLWKIADLVEEHLEEFAELESLDNGKPVSVARVADVPLSLLNPRVAASLRQLQYPAGRERDCAMLLSSLLCSSLSNTFVVGMTT